MDRYLIESPHHAHDCALIVQQIKAMGYLYHFEWGCRDGAHVGWAIIEAEDKTEALLCVPPLVRSQARAIRLNRFEPEEVDTWHTE